MGKKHSALLLWLSVAFSFVTNPMMASAGAFASKPTLAVALKESVSQESGVPDAEDAPDTQAEQEESASDEPFQALKVVDSTRHEWQRAPRPERSSGDWIGQADYPPQSYLAKEEGQARYRLVISRTGEPVKCTLVGSTGFSSLDAATCPLIMQRARFIPARDAKGKETPAIYDGQANWQIEEPELQTFDVRMSVLIDENGRVLECAVLERSGSAPVGWRDDDPCRGMNNRRGIYRDAKGRPVKRWITISMTIEESDEGPLLRFSRQSVDE